MPLLTPLAGPDSVVAWAASNGDRSENADYLYGKRRLGQIDSRIRFLTKRIDAAVVTDPAAARQGSADVVNVRVYQGIHFRFADVIARKQGRHVAQWDFAQILSPVDDDDRDDGEDDE